jgi:hypothetical protein
MLADAELCIGVPTNPGGDEMTDATPKKTAKHSHRGAPISV